MKLIDPGESYVAYVMVSREHKLVVEKEHHFCEPDDPFDGWDEDDDWFDLEEDSSDSYDEPLPMAA